MAQKRILHIQKVLGIYGSERHLLWLLPRLDPERFEIVFLVLEDPGFPVDGYVSLFDGSGVRVDRMPIHGDLDPLLILSLYKYIRMGKFDMVHTHLIHAELYGTLAANLAGVKKNICTKHGYNFYMEKLRFRLLGRAITRLHQKVIVISQAIGDFLTQREKLPPEKKVLIHYGIDPPVKHLKSSSLELKQRWGIEGDIPTIAAVGRLVPVKGHRFLVESLPVVCKTIGDFVLLFAGDGPLEEDLRKTARRLGVERYIRFLGFQPDIHPLLDTIDVLVHPSLGEGFCLAVLEAMGHGVPIVASRVLALPEVIGENIAGVLVPPGNPQALAEAIILLLTDATLRRKMGAAGRKRFLEQFTLNKMVKKTETLYGEVLGLNNSGVVTDR